MRPATLAVALAALALVLACPREAWARTVRFAVVVGNDQGAADEQALRWAEADAERIRDVLVGVGGFAPENLVLLQGRSARDVRRALIAVNERVRTLPAGDQGLLVVYYSGHADATSLHLGDTRLELDEVQQLVRGSAARMRVLVIDACRSGAVTRVKGGQKVPGFELAVDPQLVSEGAVILTASAQSEDAQESDQLRGSFFTHYLASGLLGAADADGDDQVTLDEVYRYAYEHTLRATSRSAAGVQHPTFSYALAGRGDVVLAWLAGHDERGLLELPPGRAYLVLQGDADGRVLAEVSAVDARRRVSLRAGRYFVRGRGRTYLLEGVVTLARGEQRRVEDGALERIEYARLVRKGGPIAHQLAVELGAFAHSELPNAAGGCAGASLGLGVDYPTLGLGATLAWCRSHFANPILAATTDEAVGELRAWRALDLDDWTLAPSLVVGLGLGYQRFDTTARAPDRLGAMGLAGVALRASRVVGAGLYLYAEPSAITYVLGRDGGLGSSASWRMTLGVGWLP